MQTKQTTRTKKEKELIQQYKEQQIAGHNPTIPRKYEKEVFALYTKKEQREAYKVNNIQFMEEHAKKCSMPSCMRKYKLYKRTGKIT